METTLTNTRRYRKAPITEAIIELRFAAELGAKDLTDLSEAFRRVYPQVQEFREVQVQVVAIGGSPRAKAEARNRPYRLSTTDQQQILLLLPNAFVCSQLPPYSNWEEFFERFSRDLEVFRSTIGHRQISRIGVRYINRIDIPNGSEGIIAQGDYVNIGVHLPPSLGPTIGYAVQAIVRSPSNLGNAVLNTSIVPLSIVPDHTSCNLDIDVGVEHNVPQKVSDIYKVLSEMRNDKNKLFETLITDKARAVFE